MMSVGCFFFAYEDNISPGIVQLSTENKMGELSTSEGGVFKILDMALPELANHPSMAQDLSMT